MITRQILRLVIYYLFPLVTVSVFYILIAKHLFQAKTVIFNPTGAQPFLNHLNNDKRMTQPIIHSKTVESQQGSTHLYREQSRHLSHPATVFNENTLRKNIRGCSSTVENEHIQRAQRSSSSVSSFNPSSIPLPPNVRRSKDLLCESSTISSKNYLAMHTLYQDAKTRKQMRARRKVAKTVLFLCTVFFVCWLPKQIHDLYW